MNNNALDIDIRAIQNLLHLFTKSDNGKSLLDLFTKAEQEYIKNSYSIFKVISKKFYYENFHSDISEVY